MEVVTFRPTWFTSEISLTCFDKSSPKSSAVTVVDAEQRCLQSVCRSGFMSSFLLSLGICMCQKRVRVRVPQRVLVCYGKSMMDSQLIHL